MNTAKQAERNLLFGVLALQLDFVSQPALVAAASVWVREKSRRLDRIFVEQGALDEEGRVVLEQLVEKHLQLHAGDPAVSLATLHAPTVELRDQLHRLSDGALDTSLAQLTSRAPQSQRTMETVASAATAAESVAGGAAPAPSQGTRFQILRPHARGGLGQVSVAWDAELDREVALKEIQLQFADLPDSRARFVREAKVTGGLEHPGIVPVYGLGQEVGGRPYYAMRFIRGESLKEAIADFHKSAAEPRGARAGEAADRSPSSHRFARGERGVRFRQLLARFIDVCNAIEYSHSRGVLHRDLKPANVMLGKYGETLVVDWGLAKAMGTVETNPSEHSLGPLASDDNAASTRVGSALGTPAFMSPEQARGELERLSPASDVYSLGATLFCLLTGEVPFADDNLSTLLQKVQNGDFSPPSAVAPQTPRALEAICLKAMARDPEQRYATAGELREEIERWLADEPVRAYSEPWTARVARWSRRHQTFVANAAVLLVTAVAALSIGSLMLSDANRRIEAQREIAQANAEQAEENRVLADQNFRQAWDAVNKYLTQVTTDRRLKDQGLESLRRDLLLAARDFFDDFVGRKADNHQLRLDRAHAYRMLGKITYQVDSKVEAANFLQQAVSIYAEENQHVVGCCDPQLRTVRRELGSALGELHEFGPAEDQLLLASSLLDQTPPEQRDASWTIDRVLTSADLGWLLVNASRLPEAEAHFQFALEQLESAQSQLANSEDAATAESLVGQGRNYLGAVYRRTGRFDEALEAHLAAAKIFEDLLQRFPAVAQYKSELVTSQIGAATAAAALDQFGVAEKAYARSLTLLAELRTAFPDVLSHREKEAVVAYNRGDLLEKELRYAESETSLHAARQAFETLQLQYPDNPSYTARLGVVYTSLAEVIRSQHRFNEAVDWYQQAQTLLRKTLEETPNNFSIGYHLLLTYSGYGRSAAALGDHQTAAREAGLLAEVAEGHGMADLHYDAAIIYARACQAARSDAALPPKQREELLQQWSRLAAELLEICRKRDFFTDPENRRLLLDAPEFEALRQEPSIDQLFQDLQ